MIYGGVVSAPAAMPTFNDIYRLLAMLTVVMIPSFLILSGQSVSHSPAH
jgi:hypothetical protein